MRSENNTTCGKYSRKYSREREREERGERDGGGEGGKTVLLPCVILIYLQVLHGEPGIMR